MLKRYGHLGAEVNRRAAEMARKNVANGLDVTMAEMREAGLLPALPARPSTAASTTGGEGGRGVAVGLLRAVSRPASRLSPASASRPTCRSSCSRSR